MSGLLQIPNFRAKARQAVSPHFTNGGTETCPRTHRVEVTKSELKAQVSLTSESAAVTIFF